MKVGDRVRVKGSVQVYHHPKNRNQAYDIGGMEGEIVSFANTYMMKGETYTISANFPVYVQFDKKFKVHLREDELETLSS
ncbi:MAG: ferredoxin--nitrite reductase [Symploca sp. SIO2B6]|nr:ferredoxin--nitrite reductase [Symploca sp. SIO2B6]